MTRMFRIATVLAFCAALFATAATSAAEIKMIASNAVKEAYLELLPAFESASGHKISVAWDGTPNILERVRSGETTDIVIVPADAVEALIGEGKLRAGSRVDVARSLTAVAVRVGVPRPDVSSGEALKQALLAANSIVISGGPSGLYMASLFERMGIAETIAPKLTRIPPGTSVGEAMLRGEGDIGFTQVSEFLRVKGIDYIGPLSPDVGLETVFSAGLHASAPEPGAAKELLDFLTGSDVMSVLEKAGLEPG